MEMIGDKELVDIFCDNSVPLHVKFSLASVLSRFGRVTEDVVLATIDSQHTPETHRGRAMDHYGNVWLRLQHFPVAQKLYAGHKHHHDHQTLVVRGGIQVHVEGEEPFEVWAAGESQEDKPSFFRVPAEKEHYFAPLVDDTVAYCVFAIRDENGELAREYDPAGDWNYGAKR